MMRFLVLIAFLLTELSSTEARQTAITGRVVGVSDGDTLTVLTPRNEQVRVRLAHIDAPEKAQPFGSKAKLALSRRCFGKAASVQVVDRDKYGRIVGLVQCAGADANREMVSLGLAWAYARNPRSISAYSAVEAEARSQQKGLWVDKAPVPPWEFRRTVG